MLRLRIENLVLIRAAELELAPGLNAITGETGAGKTILAQAIGLLLGARGDPGLVGSDGPEAYVEAELEVPAALAGEPELERLAELRPADEESLVLARRVFADGRTRAYAWGRTAAREDVAAAAERLVSMSGQFEQRRLGRPSYQLDVLDSFAGDEQSRRRVDARAAWAELSAATRRLHEAAQGEAGTQERIRELRALVEDTEGLEPGLDESLRAERERLRHVTELAQAAIAAAEALTPEEGSGATGQVALAERALAQVEELAPELPPLASELREAELGLRETAAALRSFLASLEADPVRLEEVEASLDRIATARRRFGADSYETLLARAAEARVELEALDAGLDPTRVAAEAVAAAQARFDAVTGTLRETRRAAAGPFADAVAAELRGIGMGEGEFRAELAEREPGPAGADAVSFLIRPNPGLPFAPVAETASGGELSRVALAIAAVGGGQTIVFDEIDAGIGGQTANAVGQALARLAKTAQVVTITHLPQIASLADRHFRVEKVPGDPTHTRIERLVGTDRRDELERMLGGREFLELVSVREGPPAG
ncbi:MAG: AAA family ATPase [Actinobacteria bacterium]|nr:AAA family ATPase [Actinomycetota bacterium]